MYPTKSSGFTLMSHATGKECLDSEKVTEIQTFFACEQNISYFCVGKIHLLVEDEFFLLWSQELQDFPVGVIDRFRLQGSKVYTGGLFRIMAETFTDYRQRYSFVPCYACP